MFKALKHLLLLCVVIGSVLFTYMSMFNFVMNYQQDIVMYLPEEEQQDKMAFFVSSVSPTYELVANIENDECSIIYSSDSILNMPLPYTTEILCSKSDLVGVIRSIEGGQDVELREGEYVFLEIDIIKGH